MRRVLIGVAVLVVLLVGSAVLGAGAILNTSTVKERVVAALSRAVGHGVVIGGPIGVVWSTVPEVSVRDLTVLNGPGYSREALATVRRVEARVALWPLLLGRVEVASVLVEGADVLLERDSQGVGNWEVARVPSGAGGAPAAPRDGGGVGEVRVVDGRVAYAGAPAVVVRSLSMAPGGGKLAGALVVNGVPLEVSGSTAAAAGGVVPFVVDGAGGGATVSAAGSAEGVTFTVKAGDLATLATLVGRALPHVAEVVLTGQVSGGVVGLKLVTGGVDLGGEVAGLRLVGSETVVTGLDQPVRVLAQVSLNGLPVAAAVTVGPRTGSGAPVQVVLTADGGTVTVAGDADVVARTLSGTVSARVPDVRRTGALAGVGLPGLHDVALDVRVQPGGAGVLLRGLRLVSAEGDLAGDLAVGVSPRASVRGSLQSQRLELDAWLSVPAVTSIGANTGASIGAPAAGQAGAAPAPPVAAGRWMIPDTPLPFAALLRMDLDVQWAAAEVVVQQVVLRTVQTRVLLQDGRLRVDPATMLAPGGALTAVAEVDVRAEPPTLALVMRGSGLDVGALTRAGDAGAGVLTGTMDLDVGLQARGITPHALAGTVTGHVAATLTDGDVDNAALLALAGPALRAAGAGFDATGRSGVKCLAVREDILAGQATFPTLVMDASRVRLEADGRVDLGQETMDVHARPEVKLGPVPVKVPVHLTGPWRAVRAEVDKGVVAPGRFGVTIGGGGGADLCGPALGVVRGGMGR